MRPLIIVNHRPQTPRAPRRPPAPPAFLTVITPLRGHPQSQPRMTTAERGLRAKTIITLFTRGAKTSITPPHPPRHPTSPLSCPPPLHHHCQALHVLRTPPLTALPLPTHSAETVHLPTVLLPQIPPILPAAVSSQVLRILHQAPSHRQSLDFPSSLIGRSSLRRHNNLTLSLTPLERARHAENLCKGHLSEPSEQCFTSTALSAWYAYGLAHFSVSDRVSAIGLRRRGSL